MPPHFPRPRRFDVLVVMLILRPCVPRARVMRSFDMYVRWEASPTIFARGCLHMIRLKLTSISYFRLFAESRYFSMNVNCGHSCQYGQQQI